MILTSIGAQCSGREQLETEQHGTNMLRLSSSSGSTTADDDDDDDDPRFIKTLLFDWKNDTSLIFNLIYYVSTCSIIDQSRHCLKDRRVTSRCVHP